MIGLTDTDLQKVLNSASKEELIELAELTSKWAKPIDCKFYYYEPWPIMRMFHMSLAKIRALFGGNRSGKTYAAVEDITCGFTGTTPKHLEGLIPPHRMDKTRRIRYCMSDYPNSFTKVIWPTIQQLVPSDSIKDIVRDSGRVKAIVNDVGGFIEFMQYDQDLSKFPGASRHLIVYDEVPPMAVRNENMKRIIDTDGEELFALTPDPNCGALGWLYDDIYLKAARIVEKLDDGSIYDKSNPLGDQDIHLFFASIYDNKTIKKEAAHRILSKFDAEEREIYEKGHLMLLAGLVYKRYSDPIHLIPNFSDWYEGPNAIDYTLYIAIDPHPRTPHAVLFYCVRRDGLHFIVDEIFKSLNAPDLVEAIKMKSRGKRPEIILIDPLASTPDPSTKSCLLYDLAAYGLNDPFPMSASKDKDRGIMRCQQRLKPNERGTPGVYVLDNCERFRYEIMRYIWDDWKRIAAESKDLKQKPVDKDDHMMENWYRIENLDPPYILPQEPDEVNEYEMVGRNARTGY